ncbi:hypothetical protein [Streptomyces sp. NPDC088261]|uniref:hypothetical protein n=1 Tax=Streptomyces sp. NPDC088261 TaxID=3365851 RepID=UPI00381E6F3B
MQKSRSMVSPDSLITLWCQHRRENPLRVATQDTVARDLINLLRDLAAEAPGGGILVSIDAGPWMGASKKERDRLYRRVVDTASKAVERGKPFVDFRKLPQGPFPLPAVGFCEALDSDHRSPSASMI